MKSGVASLATNRHWQGFESDAIYSELLKEAAATLYFAVESYQVNISMFDNYRVKIGPQRDIWFHFMKMERNHLVKWTKIGTYIIFITNNIVWSKLLCLH